MTGDNSHNCSLLVHCCVIAELYWYVWKAGYGHADSDTDMDNFKMDLYMYISYQELISAPYLMLFLQQHSLSDHATDLVIVLIYIWSRDHESKKWWDYSIAHWENPYIDMLCC